MRGVRRHIGAFEDDRPDVRMAFEQHPGGHFMFSCGSLDIQFGAIAQDLTGEIPTDLVDPLHRDPRRIGDAGRRQMSKRASLRFVRFQSR